MHSSAKRKESGWNLENGSRKFSDFCEFSEEKKSQIIEAENECICLPVRWWMMWKSLERILPPPESIKERKKEKKRKEKKERKKERKKRKKDGIIGWGRTKIKEKERKKGKEKGKRERESKAKERKAKQTSSKSWLLFWLQDPRRM